MSDVTTELAMEANDKAMEIARLKAENDKLREQSERLFDKTLELATENSKLRELCKLCEREAENAKLRELCATVIDDWMSKVCPSFPFCECGGEYQDCTDETCGNQIYRQMARELVGWAHEHD